MEGDPENAEDRFSKSKEPTLSEIGEPSLCSGACSTARTDVDRNPASEPKLKGGVHIETIDCSQLGSLLPLPDVPSKSAKTRLYEVCTGYSWNRPLFQCCKEEGEGHMKRFTSKVTVEAKESQVFLESYSLPKSKKKAAEEHAAEGALWYLRHIGY